MGDVVRLDSLDLNLLNALHALLQERNVTRAGRRIGLSQPAMSGCLSRLRRHFGDDLMIRVGGGYELTPLGVSLVDPAALAVRVVQRVFSARPEFDPASFEHEFTVATSDHALTVLGEALTRTLRAQAPRVRIRFVQITPALVDDADTALRSVDGLLMPHGFISAYPAVDVYTDRWVVIADRDNPALREGLTTEHLHSLPWAAASRGPAAVASAARRPHMPGVEPRAEVVVENFPALPFLVAGTDRVALIQERLANRLRGVADFRILPCPGEVAPLREAFWYHPVRQADAAHLWLRETFARVGAGLPPLGPAEPS
ncbi:DNA-binding transcriptional LysR family regulator [Streptosporangium becharense]|uniref:DNA-binding transcriptional LysR family regulator n=1 Tax=Streptosporangium becharense TaxID=1816182 RepID=A0A7W9MJI0_9ACTN|nr:LysR family transcriptional regulator [Streptosporangium becharense]MBB2910332.1 DNA-binding transcriptional LysR family regulator [Streptosporangium becharense]MBB5823075.1 DNA-binding transcriptional LysR family regulator [Streptosporangium becharense]